MAWYNESWKYRRKITINHLLVTTSLTGFTFNLKISDGDIAEKARSDGNDIIFVSSTDVVLSHEIIKFDKKNGDLIANIFTGVSNTVDTEIYIYFGNPNATNTQNANAANGNNYLVTHLDFDPYTAPATIPLDKGPTTLDKLGTFALGQSITLDEDSPVGHGISFNQSSAQYYRTVMGLNFGTPPATFALEAWIYKDSTDSDTIVMQGYNTTQETQDFGLMITNQKIVALLSTNQVVSTYKTGNTSLSLNQWHHVGFIWKATTKVLKIILDGNDDGAFIVNGINADCYYQRSFPTFVRTQIGNMLDTNTTTFNGRMADVKISSSDDYTENHIKLHYTNIANSGFYSVGILELNPSLIANPINKWRTELLGYTKRIKTFIKKEEVIGTEDYHKFPFLLNLYNKDLNGASVYGHDIVVTDKLGERLPFERLLFRKNINQQRYCAAYGVDLIGTAAITYDINAEGAYRASYLGSVGSSIKFKEVQTINLGLYGLVIRYSNGSGSTATNVDVVVNGVTYLVNMPSTGSWSTYSTVTVPINWTQEWNTVEIGFNSNCPDIDWIQALGQETAQLKGFVLLPTLETLEDTEIDIYFSNPAAPIRINTTGAQAEIVVEAETMTFGSGFTVESNAAYSNGSGLMLSNYATPSTASKVFTGNSGYYDIGIETISDANGASTYEIYVNGSMVKSFTTQIVSVDITRTNNIVRKIYIANGNTVSVKSISGINSVYGRFGLLRFIPTLMDPNVGWNSEEVWGDYEAVWHLEGTPGENRPFYDYSGNERHIFSFNMTAGVNKINSAIGAGVYFYDNNDKLYGQFSAMNLGLSDFTISAWLQRSPLVSANKGILVSDLINWRYEQDIRARTMYGNISTADGQYVVPATADKFLYNSFAFKSFSKERNNRVSGSNITTKIATSNTTGLNDSITLGVSRNQDALAASATDTETYKGLIAEVRIRKSFLSENWQKNESKNTMFPQQYINYGNTVCESQQLIVIVETVGGIVNTTSNINRGNLVISRANAVSTSTNTIGNQIGKIHFVRNMSGTIRLSGSGTITKIVFTRVVTGVVRASSAVGKNWTIQFARFFTGGVLSGSGNVIRVVNFIPNSFGSVSFGFINTSHVIDNGFTLNVTFNNAIGGTAATGGAIVNKVVVYIDKISGGFSWVAGTAVRKTSYFISNNTGTVLVSGSIVNLFKIVRIPQTSFPVVKLSNNVIQNNHLVTYKPLVVVTNLKTSGTAIVRNIYNVVNNTGKVTSSGNAQLNNKNIFIPLVSITNIKTSGTAIVRNTYNVINNTGKVSSVGNAITRVVVVFDVVDVNGIIKVSRTLNATHIVWYKPLMAISIYATGTVERVSKYYNITSGGVFRITTTTSSTTVNEGFTLRIVYTDNGGVIPVSGSAIRNVIYNKTDNLGVALSSGGVSFSESNYIIIDNIGLIPVTGYSIRKSNYKVINNTGKTSTSGECIKKVLFRTITPNQRILTAGLENSITTYNKIDNTGKIQVAGNITTNVKVFTVNLTSGVIHISKPSTGRIINYFPIVSGSVSFSGTVDRKNVYDYIINNPIVNLSGNSDSTSKLECYFDNKISINLGGNSWTQRTGNNVYIETFNGGIKTLSGSLTIVFDSTLIPYNKCVRGRVNTLNDLPSMANSEVGYIYYVVSNIRSNWWEYRPSGNYEPIANPFYNTGVLGVHNTIATLPLTGNSIGDVWQIGRCHDGVYYTWTGTNWEEDENYPPVIKVVTVSIIAIQTSGEALVETNYETTIIEASGKTTLDGYFIPYAGYNSTLIGGRINASGGYSGLFITTSNIGNGIITLRNDDIVPVIERNNDTVIFMEIAGSAVSSIIYNQPTAIVEVRISGTFVPKIVLPIDLSFTRVIRVSGIEQERIVDREYIPTGSIRLSGLRTADKITYVKICTNVTKIVISSTSNNYVAYGEFNDVVVIKLSTQGIAKSFISFTPKTTIYMNIFGEFKTDRVSYVKESIGNLVANIYKTVTANYIAAATGKLTWKKNTVANTVVITDKLMVSLVGSGGINTFGYYTIIKCLYNKTIVAGTVSLSRTITPQLIISNPGYTCGVIRTSGTSSNVKTSYVLRTLVVLNPVGNFLIKNNYIEETGTIFLKTSGAASDTVILKTINTGLITIGKEATVPDVRFIVSLTNKSIVLSSSTIIVVNRNESASSAKLIVSGLFPHDTTFKPLVSTSGLVLTKGASSPNGFIANVKLIGTKVLISGTPTKAVSFIVRILNPSIRTSGSALVRTIYTQRNQGSIKINNTNTYYKYVISRIPTGIIRLSKSYTERTVIFSFIPRLGKILTSGNSLCAQSHKFRVLNNGGVVRVSGLSITKYYPEYEKVVDGTIVISGGTTDPTEFNLVIFGIVNVSGFARVRPYYNNLVSTETIKVYLSSDSTYSQYHVVYAKIPTVTSVKLSGSSIHTFTRKYVGISAGTIRLSGSSTKAYVTNYMYNVSGSILTGGNASYKSFNKYIPEVELNTIVLSNIEKIYYPSYGNSITSGSIYTSGNDVTVDGFNCVYKPLPRGIIWDGGTVENTVNEYIKNDISGTILVGGKSIVVTKKIFYYEATYSHLGSIKIWGGALSKPWLKSLVIPSKIIVSNSYDIICKIGYIQKTLTPTKILVSGTNKPIIQFYPRISGTILLKGNALTKNSYNSSIELNGRIILSGNGINKTSISRVMIGSILINGIAGGNVSIVPEVTGWITISGGINSADFISYGELSSDTLFIIVTPSSKYRSHGEEPLVFHEITRRREYEGGLENSGITYPEEAWSSLQNFNDLLEKE